MSTRSVIGYVQEDGSVRGVYCHWDGGLKYNGKMLFDHYYNREKVKDLVDRGNISSLGESIGTQHEFDDRPEGETTFYYRDRGDKNQEAVVLDSIEAFQHWAEARAAEYCYVMDAAGDWKVSWITHTTDGPNHWGMTEMMYLDFALNGKAWAA